MIIYRYFCCIEQLCHCNSLFQGPQVEIGSNFSKSGIEKRANVKFTGKVEFYETGVAVPMPLSGIAICVKRKGSPNAEVMKVINVTIKRHRYTLMPGINTTRRRVTVRGQDIGDVPTKYTMTGLQPYEIPVVGKWKIAICIARAIESRVEARSV